MRWTALNGVGAIFWIAGLYLAGGVQQPIAVASFVPINPLLVAFAFGFIGLATLLWANLADV